MSLHGDYDSDNIFAKIIRGDMPCVKLYEDDDIISIMDVFPQSEGHVLVIPKAPSRNLLEMDSTDLAPLFAKVQEIAQAIEKALRPNGIVMSQFNGGPAGQTVFHTHIHLIPRYMGRVVRSHAGGEMANIDDLTAICEKIKAAL